MKRISVREVSEILSSREMKQTLGAGCGGGCGGGSGVDSVSDTAGCECYVNSAGTACEKTCCAPKWENNTLVSKSCKYYAAIPSAGMAAFCSCG